MGGAPPILFNFFNNFYGMGGQTDGETMGYKILARVGAGVNPENMHSERVDGYNPLAVADAVARKKKILLEGRGPVLMDTITYRYSGHSPSDASSYRTKEEVELWQGADAIDSYGAYLIENKVDDRGQARRDPRRDDRADDRGPQARLQRFRERARRRPIHRVGHVLERQGREARRRYSRRARAQERDRSATSRITPA